MTKTFFTRWWSYTLACRRATRGHSGGEKISGVGKRSAFFLRAGHDGHRLTVVSRRRKGSLAGAGSTFLYDSAPLYGGQHALHLVGVSRFASATTTRRLQDTQRNNPYIPQHANITPAAEPFYPSPANMPLANGLAISFA